MPPVDNDLIAQIVAAQPIVEARPPAPPAGQAGVDEVFVETPPAVVDEVVEPKAEEPPPPVEKPAEPVADAKAEAKAKKAELYEKLSAALQDDKAFKKKESQYAQKAKEADVYKERLTSLEKRIKEDPDAALKELGTDFAELTDKKLSDKPKEAWEIALEQERAARKAIEEKLQLAQSREEQLSKERYEQQMTLARARFRETAVQKFPFVTAFDAVDHAEAMIIHEAQQKGRSLSDEEGLALVETTIVDRFKKVLKLPQFEEFCRQERPEWFAPKTPTPPPKPASSKPSGSVPAGQVASPKVPENISRDDLINKILRERNAK